jgi:hypothetical protein
VTTGEYPANIEAYFNDMDDTWLMGLYVGECYANYWVFSSGYIELDLDSWCILEEKSFVTICQFMKTIGDLISKKVNFTWEGLGKALFHYDPSAQKMFPDGERRLQFL